MSENQTSVNTRLVEQIVTPFLSPYYQDDSVTIYHGDALKIAPLLSGVEAVISDPPYGMNVNTDNSRFSGGTAGNMAKRGNGPGTGAGTPIHGDDKPFDPSPWLEYDKVILWGFNHFAQRLQVGTTLIWIKRYDEAFGSFLSDAELAWMKGGHGVYCRRDLSLTGETRERIHPTQKPLELMKWCIQKAKMPGLILDPFMGSGTTLRAAKDLGLRAVGIEIEERFCEAAARRMTQEVLCL